MVHVHTQLGVPIHHTQQQAETIHHVCIALYYGHALSNNMQNLRS